MGEGKVGIKGVLTIAGLVYCLFPVESRADVYDCSSGYKIIYQEAPCQNGVNLSLDPAIQLSIKNSGPKRFFKPLDPPLPYRPVREKEITREQLVSFFLNVKNACASRNFNEFYATFNYSFRREFNKKGPEELADRMRWYCSNDYAPEMLNKLVSSGTLSVRESSSTKQGIKKGILCWSPPGLTECKMGVDVAVDSGKVVRDEF